MKPDLLILTNKFPNSPLTTETWLADELLITHSFYNSITLLPGEAAQEHIQLPGNCRVLKVNTEKTKLNLKEIINCLGIVLSDFSKYPSKADYFKTFRYNLSLIKELSLRAKNISGQLPASSNKLIVYAYWADNLLTMAGILKQLYVDCTIVSRAHGFEIFEDQTKFNVIPFRNFQIKFSDKILADSKKGCAHLQTKNPDKKIFHTSYVGTIDNGLGYFDQNENFTIVTCSNLTTLKRMYLMPDILQYISFPLTWNLIGMGEDLENIKLKNSKLPKNITVNYIGNLKNKEVLQFFKANQANLFVSLSYSEGLPVSMMEALSFGVPLMSTDVGGCSEICNENTGFLIDKDFNCKEVADKITEFKNSDKNTIQFKQHCRGNWLKNFSAEKNYMAFCNLIIQ